MKGRSLSIGTRLFISRWGVGLFIVCAIVATASGYMAYDAHASALNGDEKEPGVTANTSSDFSHSALIQQPTDRYIGSSSSGEFDTGERLRNRSTYYTAASPVLNASYAVSYTGTPSEPAEVSVEFFLVYRSVDQEGESEDVHWEHKEQLSTANRTVDSGEEIHLLQSINVSEARARANELNQQETQNSPSGPTTTEIVLRADTTIQGKAGNETFTDTRKDKLRIIPRAQSYSVTTNVSGPASYQNSVQGPLLIAGLPIELYGLVALTAVTGIGAVYIGTGKLRNWFAVSDKEKEQYRYETARSDYAEWVATGSAPDLSGADILTVSTFRELVELAIDNDCRVIEDGDRYFVHANDSVYTYTPPTGEDDGELDDEDDIESAGEDDGELDDNEDVESDSDEAIEMWVPPSVDTDSHSTESSTTPTATDDKKRTGSASSPDSTDAPDSDKGDSAPSISPDDSGGSTETVAPTSAEGKQPDKAASETDEGTAVTDESSVERSGETAVGSEPTAYENKQDTETVEKSEDVTETAGGQGAELTKTPAEEFVFDLQGNNPTTDISGIADGKKEEAEPQQLGDERPEEEEEGKEEGEESGFELVVESSQANDNYHPIDDTETETEPTDYPADSENQTESQQSRSEKSEEENGFEWVGERTETNQPDSSVGDTAPAAVSTDTESTSGHQSTNGDQSGTNTSTHITGVPSGDSDSTSSDTTSEQSEADGTIESEIAVIKIMSAGVRAQLLSSWVEKEQESD